MGRPLLIFKRLGDSPLPPRAKGFWGESQGRAVAWNPATWACSSEARDAVIGTGTASPDPARRAEPGRMALPLSRLRLRWSDAVERCPATPRAAVRRCAQVWCPPQAERRSPARIWAPSGACGPRQVPAAAASALCWRTRLPAVCPESWETARGRPLGHFRPHCVRDPTQVCFSPLLCLPFSTITAQFVFPWAVLAQDIQLVFCDFIIPVERRGLIRNSPGLKVYKAGLRLSDWDLWSKFLPWMFSGSFPLLFSPKR